MTLIGQKSKDEQFRESDKQTLLVEIEKYWYYHLEKWKKIISILYEIRW